MDNLITKLLSYIPVTGALQTIIGAAAILLLTALAAWLIRSIVFGLTRRLTRQTRTTLDDDLLKAGRRPVHFLVYLIGGVSLFDFLEMRVGEGYEAVFRWIDGAMYVLMIFVIAYLLVKIATVALSWYGSAIASKTETTVDDEFIPLLDRAVKIIVYVLAILIVLDHFQVDIKGLIAVLGVGSLAIALAAQETIANMIGGFVIMIDRPFRQGDRVRLDDGTVCVVHAIGIRSTKFWTFDNTLIIVPNAELMKSTVHNITYPFPRVRVKINVGVSYDSDMGLVERAMLEEASKHPKVLDDPGPSFFFLEFGESSLDVTLRCHVEDLADQFRTASDLRFMVLDRFREEGIEIPFPQRVITMVGGTELPAAGEPGAKKPIGRTERVQPTQRTSRPGRVRGGSVDIDDDD